MRMLSRAVPTVCWSPAHVKAQPSVCLYKTLRVKTGDHVEDPVTRLCGYWEGLSG